MKRATNSFRTRHSSKSPVVLAAIIVAGLFAFGFSPHIQTASASSVSVIGCSDGSNSHLNNTNVALGSTVHCHTFSTNPNSDKVHFWVVSPNGNTTDTGLIAYIRGQNLTFSWVANVPGDWSAHVIYYDVDGTQAPVCVCNMHVSFFVLPETSIGALGLLGSSLGALGLFIHFRKSKPTKKAT